MKIMENNLNINEWSINFWIKENSLIYNDDKITEIFNLNPIWWSIFMIKDSDNLFKIMYVVIWKWRVDLEYNASNLDINKPHMITITWNISSNLILYIDGKEEKNIAIKF